MTGHKVFWNALFLLALCLFLAASPVQADICIQKAKRTVIPAGSGEKAPKPVEENSLTWMSRDRLREDTGETSLIIRLDQKKIYLNIDHSRKTYSEVDLPVDMEKLIPPEGWEMAQWMEISGIFKETGKTRKIRDWNCQQYFCEISVSLMEMSIPVEIEIWSTADLGRDLSPYPRFQAEILTTNPFTRDISEEFKKIRGFPVLTRFSMSTPGGEYRYEEEVLVIEKKDAPARTYDLPPGYTRVPFNPLSLSPLEKR